MRTPLAVIGVSLALGILGLGSACDSGGADVVASDDGGSSTSGGSSSGATSGSSSGGSSSGASSSGGSSSGGSSSGGSSSGGSSSGSSGTDGGTDAGQQDSGCFPGTVPNGTTCHENGPNPNPLDPPNTPCCDGVCNHSSVPYVCGCSATNQPCSDYNLAGLYGTDCCPGLECLQFPTGDVCHTRLADGQKCYQWNGNCADGICNGITDLCGASPVGSQCTANQDCASPSTCKIDLGPPGVCCYPDATSCTADNQCCGGVCDMATGKCGCGGDGAGCTRTADCCAATGPKCNSMSKCGCVAAGATCGVTADCCTGAVCNTATTKCGCSMGGGACSVAGDCCSGLTCGAAGACCKASGASCGAGTECCSGSCKGNGSCQ